MSALEIVAYNIYQEVDKVALSFNAKLNLASIYWGLTSTCKSSRKYLHQLLSPLRTKYIFRLTKTERTPEHTTIATYSPNFKRNGPYLQYDEFGQRQEGYYLDDEEVYNYTKVVPTRTTFGSWSKKIITSYYNRIKTSELTFYIDACTDHPNSWSISYEFTQGDGYTVNEMESPNGYDLNLHANNSTIGFTTKRSVIYAFVEGQSIRSLMWRLAETTSMDDTCDLLEQLNAEYGLNADVDSIEKYYAI